MAAALASSRCCCRSSPPLAGLGHRSVTRCALSGEKRNSFSWKECAISAALSVGLITGTPTLGWSAHASPLEHVLPDVSVLISGPPIKDLGALLRYALPIDNKAICEVQKPLEDITDSLKVAGVRALDSVGRVSHAFEVPGSTEFLRFPWLTFKAMRTKLTERSDFVQRMYKDRMFLL